MAMFPRNTNVLIILHLRGKVVVILNVATNWGLANTNYNQLQALYTRYEAQGLRVAAFPCNQFAGQVIEKLILYLYTHFEARVMAE